PQAPAAPADAGEDADLGQKKRGRRGLFGRKRKDSDAADTRAPAPQTGKDTGRTAATSAGAAGAAGVAAAAGSAFAPDRAEQPGAATGPAPAGTAGDRSDTTQDQLASPAARTDQPGPLTRS